MEELTLRVLQCESAACGGLVESLPSRSLLGEWLKSVYCVGIAPDRVLCCTLINRQPSVLYGSIYCMYVMCSHYHYFSADCSLSRSPSQCIVQGVARI